jgi:hypothetical protein
MHLYNGLLVREISGTCSGNLITAKISEFILKIHATEQKIDMHELDEAQKRIHGCYQKSE